MYYSPDDDIRYGHNVSIAQEVWTCLDVHHSVSPVQSIPRAAEVPNSCHHDIMKVSKLKTHISGLNIQLEDAPIDDTIRVVLVELRVCDLQGRFWTIADNLLAPDVPQPIRAPYVRRSVTSLLGGHSLAPKFSWPIRALGFLGKERPLHEEGTFDVSEMEQVRSTVPLDIH